MKPISLFMALFIVLVAPEARGRSMEAGVEFQAGFIPLFNVDDGTYTKGDPALGLAAYAERRVLHRLYVGGEFGCMWIKSIHAERPRLILNPMARVRFVVPLGGPLTMHLMAGAGGTIWTKDPRTDMGLGVDLSDARGGFSLRIGLGLSYPITRRTVLYLYGGYFASNTTGGGVSVVMDTVLLSTGLGYRF